MRMNKQNIREAIRRMLCVALALLIAVSMSVMLTSCKGGKTEVSGEVKVHIIDVGQGDCILIEAPEGKMLIDTGIPDSASDLRTYLWNLGVTTIDYLVLTHGHSDHYGGAEMVLKTFIVKNIVYDNYNNTYPKSVITKIMAEDGANLIDPWQKQRFSMGSAEFTVLYATNDTESFGDNENDYSTVLRMDFGESSFVFTGDATKTVERDILTSFDPKWLDCDFLKSGHHGSYTSSGESFIEVLSPEIVAISCGRDNEYGHPHREVMETYSEAGCRVYRTDESGTLVFVSDGMSITYKEG